MTDRARGGVGDEVKEFAPTLPKKIPNGGCFSKDGFLYIVEQNRVLEYPAAEFFYESPDVVAGVVVAEGELIPKSEESYNHTARVCRIGPDNKLYIQLGQPYNVPAKEKFDLYRKLGIGGIIRMDRDGKNREVYAVDCAIRSAWISTRRTSRSGPTTTRSTAWATRFPRAIEPHRQQRSGFRLPLVWRRQDPHQRVQERYPACERRSSPKWSRQHTQPTSVVLYTGNMFPEEVSGRDLLDPAWLVESNRPVGARLMVTFLKDDGHAAGKSEPFAEGWNDNGYYLGRPVDVAQLADGSLIVSDDLVGALYRISYDGKWFWCPGWPRLRAIPSIVRPSDARIQDDGCVFTDGNVARQTARVGWSSGGGRQRRMPAT